MFYSITNKRAIYLHIFICFFTIHFSYGSTPPPPPGDDVQDVALPIDKWQKVLVIPALLLGMFYIYKNSVQPEAKKTD